MATTRNETMKPNDETTLSSFLNNWFSIPRPRDREDKWMTAWPTAAKRPFKFQTTTTGVTVFPWNSWNPDHLLFPDTDSVQEDLLLERPTAAQVSV